MHCREIGNIVRQNDEAVFSRVFHLLFIRRCLPACLDCRESLPTAQAQRVGNQRMHIFIKVNLRASHFHLPSFHRVSAGSLACKSQISVRLALAAVFGRPHGGRMLSHRLIDVRQLGDLLIDLLLVIVIVREGVVYLSRV